MLARAAGSAPVVSFQFGEFTQTIPRKRFLAFGFERAAYSRQGLVAALNVPAVFVSAPISWIVAQRPRWTPGGLMPWQWLVFTYPVYALPAWIFVGWALGSCIHRRPVRAVVGWGSAVLAGAFASIAISLQFGMTEAERANQDLLPSYIVGFAFWACLLTLPFVAMLRSRRRSGGEIGEAIGR